MLERIIPYETNLFYLINSSHNAFLDNVMWLYTGYKIWIPVYLFFIFLLVYKKDRRDWLPVILSIIAVFVLCTLFSSGITKPLFARHRPTHFPSVMEYVRTLNDYRGEGIYGFISGHSINSFGFAVFTALLFRQRLYTVVIFIWAFIMVYSRVYLGVHFISDIIAGTLAEF